MKALGDYLRQSREAAGISLPEIQEKTKIRQYYLEAIESGNFDALPGEVYQKGFIRNYAAAIGLDERDVMDRFHQLEKAKSAPESPESEPVVVVKPHTLPVAATMTASNTSKDSAFKKAIPLIIIAGLAIGIISGWILVSRLSSKAKPGVSISTAAKPVKIKPAVMKPANKDTSKDSLKLIADADVWIRLTDKTAGRMIEEVTLHKGDTREWKLDRKLVLLNGNAGKLRISILGSPFKVYGTDGQVVTATYTAQGEEQKAEN